MIVKNRFAHWVRPKIAHGEFTKWKWLVWYPKKLKLGKNTDIGALCYLNAKYGLIVEDNVQIGSGTKIYTENTEDGTHGKVIIKKNAMIGANCVILPRRDGKPLIIGERARIKAGTTVTKSIPANFRYP